MKKLRTIYHTLACGSTSAINSSAVVQSILHDEGEYHDTSTLKDIKTYE